MKQQRPTDRRRSWKTAVMASAAMLVVLTSAASSQAVTIPARLRPAADTTTIEIHSTSAALAFDPAVISVKQGAIVRIRYVNESTFTHNLVILRKEDDIDAVGAASFGAGETGFVPMEHKGKMIAYSPLASAGKTVEFTFLAPPAGEYPYVCFVDGHFNMMLGKLRSLK